MEVEALFGRFVWRGVNIDDVTIPILPEVRTQPVAHASPDTKEWRA